jgi:hypothetical protein
VAAYPEEAMEEARAAVAALREDKKALWRAVDRLGRRDAEREAEMEALRRCERCEI